MSDAAMDCDDQTPDLCYQAYRRLGKSGKPDPNTEYTVLAAIVCEYRKAPVFGGLRQVVALTTGTKCQPYNEELRSQLIVDSHAESLLKRAFKRHLISLLETDFQLDDISSIDLFVSQLPCGSVERWKGGLTDTLQMTHSNKKPGRGEVCRRATCLKKITKWAHMGLQGKRLIQYTKRPVHIDNIVIGNCGPSGECQQRLGQDLFALRDECDEYKPFNLKRLPKTKFCEKFRNQEFVKSDEKQSTSTAIVSWITGYGQTVSEVLTEGHKLGVTAKNLRRSRLLISDSVINEDIDRLDCDKEDDLCAIYESQWNQLKKLKTFQ